MIEKNNIVTVINKKSELYDCQGIIVSTNGENKKYPVVVLFKDGVYDVHFNFILSPDERTKNFKKDELRVDDDWKLEIRAIRIFENNFHTIKTAPKGYNPENKCDASNFDFMKGCKGSLATKKALVNFVGTIYEIKMCDACFKKYHGHHFD